MIIGCLTTSVKAKADTFNDYFAHIDSALAPKNPQNQTLDKMIYSYLFRYRHIL